jgi:hypothetical protein
MMTSEERNDYRQKMRAAGTAEERERGGGGRGPTTCADGPWDACCWLMSS